ncbi:MAG: hypothetical protein N3I86_00480 [Verrucomicrobiae bacterium]|nr:hypothetical protein [Verrucomicrobiae bacterium]MDW8308073.1 hypothetical protein [Verrucomicrobiales bacterium]
MKASDASAPKTDPLDLELPDWSGMDDSPRPISVETAFRLCEAYAKWFPEQAKRWREQRPEKCTVEFVLR